MNRQKLSRLPSEKVKKAERCSFWLAATSLVSICLAIFFSGEVVEVEDKGPMAAWHFGLSLLVALITYTEQRKAAKRVVMVYEERLKEAGIEIEREED